MKKIPLCQEKCTFRHAAGLTARPVCGELRGHTGSHRGSSPRWPEKEFEWPDKLERKP